jgi:phosphotransferase system IIB component
MGVSRVSQLHDNIAATELRLPVEQVAALDAASAPEAAMIYGLFTPQARQQLVFGGSSVSSRR